MIKILVVDDDIVSRTLLINILREYGDIDSVQSADQGIGAFTQGHTTSDPYDLILLDRVMPEKDGNSVLKHIKRYEADRNFRSFEECKVVMVTGLNKPDEVLGSFREQCDAYIVKPITREKVIAAIKSSGITL